MQDMYPVLGEADMIVLAALIYSLGSDKVYDGAIDEYQKCFLDYLKLENMGVFTALEKQDDSEEKLEVIKNKIVEIQFQMSWYVY